MDLARILFTVICFGFFIIILFFTYRKGARKDYDDAARDIVDDDDSTEALPEVNSQDSFTHGNGANK